MNQLQVLIFTAGAATLLSVSSCSRNQPTTEITRSPTPSPKTSTVATPTPVSAANLAQPTLLTPGQRTQLLEVNVVLPSYLPTGFQITELIAEKGAAAGQPSRPSDVPFYQIIYRGSDGTCIRVGSGNQGWRDMPANQTIVNTPQFGQVRVDYGIVKRQTGDIAIIQAVLPGKEGYWIDSGKDNKGTCKPVPLEEYTKVLQSLNYLQAEASPSPTPTSSANVDPICRSYFRQITTADASPAVVKADNGTEKSVSNGTIVRFNLAAARGDRSEITLPDGFRGWIDNKNLRENPVGTSQFTGKMQVKTLDGSAVNVRDQPSLNGRVIGTLPNAMEVSVTEKKTGNWWAITAKGGIQGYVADQFLICK